MAEYPQALDWFVDSSRVFIGQNSHSAIVLHGTGGSESQTAQQLGDFFRTTPNETSVHYGVGRDGVIAQYVREADGAAGNCCVEAGHDAFWDQFGGENLNVHTISIETINDAANSLALTTAQKASLFKLVGFLVKKYSIPLSHIKSHASIAPSSRTRCPGPLFPWDELTVFLNGGSSMGIPSSWHDDGHTLIAPNGIPVILGFRDYILSHAWDAGNWPLAPEAGIAQLELSNPTLGGGTQQLFRWKMLGWTKERGVFEEWLGAELYVVRQVLQSLKTPPADIVAFLTTLLGASEQLSGQIEAILKQLQPAP